MCAYQEQGMLKGGKGLEGDKSKSVQWHSGNLLYTISGAEDVIWAPWHWADANRLAPRGPRQPQDVLPGPVSPARTLESQTLVTAY